MAAKKTGKAPAKVAPQEIKGKLVLKDTLSPRQRERTIAWAKEHGFETVGQASITPKEQPATKKKKSK